MASSIAGGLFHLFGEQVVQIARSPGVEWVQSARSCPSPRSMPDPGNGWGNRSGWRCAKQGHASGVIGHEQHARCASLAVHQRAGRFLSFHHPGSCGERPPVDSHSLSDQLLGGLLLRSRPGQVLADELLRCVPGALHGGVPVPVWTPVSSTHSSWTHLRSPSYYLSAEYTEQHRDLGSWGYSRPHSDRGGARGTS